MTDEKAATEIVQDISKDVESTHQPSKGDVFLDDPDEGLSEEEKARIVNWPIHFFIAVVQKKKRLTTNRIGNWSGNLTIG